MQCVFDFAGIPFELRQAFEPWYPTPLPLFVCKARAFVTEWTSYASILTITAFSAERWIAICYPFKAQLFSTLTRAVHIIVTVWLLAAVSAMPVAYFVTINRLLLQNNTDMVASDVTDDQVHILDTDFCALDMYDHRGQSFVIHLGFWGFFCLPMTAITILYIHIGFKIRAAILHLKTKSEASREAIMNRKGVLRMLGRCWNCSACILRSTFRLLQ